MVMFWISIALGAAAVIALLFGAVGPGLGLLAVAVFVGFLVEVPVTRHPQQR